jgi:ATP phosphoribosyltransferase regulatory subunit
MNDDRWLLPEGIDELLPEDAQYLEVLRRRLLDLFYAWGYQLVIPPVIEYIESLLTGIGRDLDLQTFKLVDQQNGRMLGIRADMTPQVARIDAHRLGQEGPARLCYLGTVLRTRSDDFTNTRNIMQIGAELYGHSGVESDVEIISLMIAMLEETEINDIFIDLGHVKIFRELSIQAKLNADQQSELFEALQRKSIPDIESILSPIKLKKELVTMIKELIWLNGDNGVIENARKVLKAASSSVHDAIDELEAIAVKIKKRNPNIQLHYDLAEVRGLNYHTGIVFSAYQPGVGQAIAQGGRYDDIGLSFGRSRPATGFSADIRRLIQVSRVKAPSLSGIFAPADEDIDLVNKIKELRATGQRVVRELPGQNGKASDSGCDKQLVLNNGVWQIKEMSRS